MRRTLFILGIAAMLGLAPEAQANDRQDAAAAEQIAGILRSSGKMRDYGIGVKYKKGTVWLNGRVTSRQQAQAALAVVGDIEGVQQIVNNLQVDSGSKLRQPGRGKSRSPIKLANATSGAPAYDRPPAGYAPLAGQDDGGDGEDGGRGAGGGAAGTGRPLPMYGGGAVPGAAPATFDEPHMPGYAWPSYAAYPNYAAVTYPKQYSPTAWPFIGPFYPYPQVPLGWRKVSLEWEDGWWMLDFDDRGCQ